jgi:hypothetical protein
VVPHEERLDVSTLDLLEPANLRVVGGKVFSENDQTVGS